MKYKIEKNTVQETLVIPLYSRKLCTELYPNLFQDETAEKLEQGVIRHFAFAVEDVEACVAAVRAGGYPILVEPKTVAIGGNPAFSAKIAFCKGALGEEIEFFQQMWQ